MPEEEVAKGLSRKVSRYSVRCRTCGKTRVYDVWFSPAEDFEEAGWWQDKDDLWHCQACFEMNGRKVKEGE